MSSNLFDNSGLEREGEFDLKSTLFNYLRYWYIFVISILIALFIGQIYISYTTPVYRIESSILIKDDKKAGNELLKEMDLFSSKKTIENEIEILKSRTLMERAIEELDFKFSYYWIGNVTVQELYKKSPFVVFSDSILFSKAEFNVKILNDSKFNISYSVKGKNNEVGEYFFDEKINTVIGEISLSKTAHFNDSYFNDLDLREKERNFRFKFNSKEENVAIYRGKLIIEFVDKKATVLRLSLLDQVPEKGKDLINKIVDVYKNGGINEKNELARNTLQFIQGRLKLIASDLGEIELTEEEFKTNKGITDISSEARIFMEKIKSFDSQYSELSIKLNAIEALENYLKADNGFISYAPTTLGIEDPLLIKLVSQLSELEIQKSRFTGNSKTENPVYFNLNLDNQISRTKIILQENTKKIKERLLRTMTEVRRMISELEIELKSLPKTSRELISIHRQQKIKENLYLYLLQKQEETAVSLASTVSDCRVLDSAETTRNPVKPVNKIVYFLSMFMGIVAPMIFIGLKDYFNTKVIDRSEIESQTETPIIGNINQIERGNENNLVVNQKSKTAVSEQFRSIRTNLQYFAAGKNLKTILVTSSHGGEGKTFIATNIAATMALSGKRSVILELDLRKPKLSLGLGLSNEIGLSNYLIGSVSVDEIIKKVDYSDNLFIISSGPIPPNPAELIMTSKMAELIEILKSKYDYIILDSPPVGLVTDGFILSKFADASLYVIRQNVTEKPQLYLIKEIHRNNKLNNLSIIFNGISKGIGKYAYGEKYSYGSNYGYGYFDEEVALKKSTWSKVINYFKG